MSLLLISPLGTICASCRLAALYFLSVLIEKSALKPIFIGLFTHFSINPLIALYKIHQRVKGTG